MARKAKKSEQDLQQLVADADTGGFCGAHKAAVDETLAAAQ